jgi:transcriptional regulator with XRE-family HTH domain
MARAALALGVRDLGRIAHLSPNTIARFERGDVLRSSTLAVIQAALKAAGVIFTPENGDGPGVKLRKAK